MASAVIRNAGELLGAAAVAAVVLGAAAIVATIWLRRRWGRLRLLMVRRVSGLPLVVAAAGWRWLWSRPLPDRRRRSIRSSRRQLSGALSGAEHAVAVARSTGAPLGDLESLCRRLRRSVTVVNRSLRIAQRATAPLADAGTTRQAADLVVAAGRIQQAAAMAVAGTSVPATTELVDDVQREVTAMTAGIARAGGRFEPLRSPPPVGTAVATIASR